MRSLFNSNLGAAESPQYVHITKIQSSSIAVKWHGFSKCRYANGPIASFRVQYYAVPSGKLITTDRKVDFTRYEYSEGATIWLSGLTPYTNYSIQVAAVNILGHIGPYSDPITVQTAEDSELP